MLIPLVHLSEMAALILERYEGVHPTHSSVHIGACNYSSSDVHLFGQTGHVRLESCCDGRVSLLWPHGARVRIDGLHRRATLLRLEACQQAQSSRRDILLLTLLCEEMLSDSKLLMAADAV